MALDEPEAARLPAARELSGGNADVEPKETGGRDADAYTVGCSLLDGTVRTSVIVDDGQMLSLSNLICQSFYSLISWMTLRRIFASRAWGFASV